MHRTERGDRFVLLYIRITSSWTTIVCAEESWVREAPARSRDVVNERIPIVQKDAEETMGDDEGNLWIP